MNDTLVLDMTYSWTNDSVTFTSLNKTASGNPVLNDALLFPVSDNYQSFFQFGGDSSYLIDGNGPPQVALWQFTNNGGGNGSWSKFNTGDGSGFWNITRPARALAATVDNTFFMLGGVEDRESSPSGESLGNSVAALSGIAAFNITTGIVSTTFYLKMR